ncbi:pentapeptide repeat-containing protein [Actinomadura rudentiformis]|uniref:Pentapeptide repeat-containing protein n=1 Tax=Actinomadura rudentiformis TaxID=359158 RepID=A0A6H9YDG1_9ACTN|nr:pentapeptide repeat-containing protein [Actinomadura rudentiformis]
MTRFRRRGQYEFARPAMRGVGTVLAGGGLVALAAVYAVALWRMPDWMHQHDPKDRHSARLLVVSAGGAVVVAVSLLYTARSYRLSHRGQVTDRFTKALERLSSGDIDARLGGIHALAHVAADSRPHHDDVVEVLEAFLRRRAPKARRDDGPALAPRPRMPERPDSDVQAALTALGRRPRRPERRNLDLSDLHLARARLADLDLRNVYLRGADLRGANLGRIFLASAILREANLRGASLDGGNLVGASLVDADLRDASLERTNLEGAILRNASLRRAWLWSAILRGASLRGVDLGEAGLSYADLRGTRLEGLNLEGADLRGANLRRATLRGVDLRGANLTGASLEGADLRDVTGWSEREIRAAAKVDERTRF